MSLSAADRDPSVDPGVDFYRFANGGWLDATPIPAGYGAWGAFEELSVRNEAILHELLVQASSEPAGDLDRMLGDHFSAGMDTAAIEAAGLTSIRPMLDRIDAVTSASEMIALLPDLHVWGMTPLFGFGVTLDHVDATRHLLWLAQAGLGLPNRESYLADGEAQQALRQDYVRHVAAQLVNLGAGPDDAPRRAGGVLDLETRLAQLHLPAQELRDPEKTLNRHSVAELDVLAPALGLPSYLLAIGAADVTDVNVQNPAYLAGLAAVLEATDADILRAYAAFHVVKAMADALPAAVDEEAFSFYGRRIRGQKEQKERYKRVIDAVSADMGQALSQRYVARVFPPAAKQRAVAMVAHIVEEMRHSLRTRAWMSEQTRQRGLAKLDAMRVKIGYPDRWRDWSGLRVGRTSYAQNRLAAARFELERQIRQLSEPVDVTEWEMPPHVVNAYYHPTRNEIVFPAGILQPPMFDADADDALNYGAIGAVIGHEITHGFDDQERRFDADGAFRDWWTAADQEAFTAEAERLVTQFDAYEILDDVRVNGRLTLGENIADLGGIALARRAHARLCEQDGEGAAGSAEERDVDGLSPAQRFFLAYATIWRANVSEELQRTLAQVDSHSPRHLRVRGPLSNITAFAEAFGLSDDAPMMRPPRERIEIW